MTLRAKPAAANGQVNSPATQAAAAAALSTHAPAGGSGRATITTGNPSARAACSFGCVAAPPDALHTSTSIL